MKKPLIVILLVIFITPSIALASWWNPFSWKVFKKKEPVQQVQVISTEKEKTPEEKNTITGSPNLFKDNKKSNELTPDIKNKAISTNTPVHKNSINTIPTQEIKTPEKIIVSAPEIKIDLCPNLAYEQNSLPYGMVKESSSRGWCYYPADDFCVNIEGYQSALPDGYRREVPSKNCFVLTTVVSTYNPTYTSSLDSSLYSSYSSLGRNKGEVVFQKSGCDYYIVETSMGYSLLEHYGGFYESEGDIIYGNLNSYGFKDITNSNGREGRVYIEDYMMSKSNALEEYYDKCD